MIISQSFPPDIGGVETHLSDLTSELEKKMPVFVCTLKPIVTGIKNYNPLEKYGRMEIRRFWWFGGHINIFRILERFPPLLFLYITPYLFIRTFFFMIFRFTEISVINVHGINAAFAGWLLSVIFRKKLVMQTHALYSFRKNSLFTCAVRFIMNRQTEILALCSASARELADIGVKKEKIEQYRYWIDLDRFSTAPKKPQKKQIGWPDVFSVLFTGRLISIKGTAILGRLAEDFPSCRFYIIGYGPDVQEILAYAEKKSNFIYLGLIPNTELADYYRAADITIVPSQYPEGFGRVICESLACGTPVIASKIGGIPDALDERAGILCGPDYAGFKNALMYLLNHPQEYRKLVLNARSSAEQRFSSKNFENIYRSLVNL
ncbi:MAG: hypothetical protein A2096_05235 [Spirochaetes bacterium GWF1_41_5]|nr:MAG: hypothetical protein A2096_05235 [Spirochaetes bacterium GWF1_41_5]